MNLIAKADALTKTLNKLPYLNRNSSMQKLNNISALIASSSHDLNNLSVQKGAEYPPPYEDHIKKPLYEEVGRNNSTMLLMGLKSKKNLS